MGKLLERASVRFGFATAQKIKITTLMCLEYMVQVHSAVAPLVMRRARFPPALALFNFSFRYQKLQAAAVYIQLNFISISNAGERAAHRRFGRDMNYDRAEARAAAAGVTQP